MKKIITLLSLLSVTGFCFAGISVEKIDGTTVMYVSENSEDVYIIELENNSCSTSIFFHDLTANKSVEVMWLTGLFSEQAILNNLNAFHSIRKNAESFESFHNTVFSIISKLSRVDTISMHEDVSFVEQHADLVQDHERFAVLYTITY